MKVYLVNPAFRRTIWSFDAFQPSGGSPFTPLGLATVAAITPPHWEVEIVDENVDAIDFDVDADLIGITAFNVQYARALEIAAEFRRRDKPVVFGGPFCSLVPEAFEGKCDFRIVGEAEQIWPVFLGDFEAGKARECYFASQERGDLESSPAPRYDLIRSERYLFFTLQTSRGCPFRCEFCDIILLDGRVPRVKSVEQVVTEVEQCVQLGARNIAFGDANFIGNMQYARKLLRALADYSASNDYPTEFSCELTINVAHHPELLELLQAANFNTVYVGIDSPRHASLAETKKFQNTRRSMREDIERIHSYHISTSVGMIVGFDADDRLIFKEVYEYLQELGAPLTTCGELVALRNTSLFTRLKSEQRLLSEDWAAMDGHGGADCNFVPKQMSLEELHRGYNWLICCLYRYDSYGERLVTCLNRFQNRNPEHRRTAPDWNLGLFLIQILAYYLLTFDVERVRFFTRTLWRVAASGPFSVGKWLEYFKWIAALRAFRQYVIDAHGIPEHKQPGTPPFEGEPESPPSSAAVGGGTAYGAEPTGSARTRDATARTLRHSIQ